MPSLRAVVHLVFFADWHYPSVLYSCAPPPLMPQGVLVGDSWPDRRAAWQLGVHSPQFTGIACQPGLGAPSVMVTGW